uniref:Calponin-homology (CH) domain-containing protein n=1 Tax=Poecilia reticulata TaxID=8081 RepID=A0A3P9N0J5_POERE
MTGHVLQIQKRTFTNWVNAQLAKRRPPSTIRDLFNDFRDGSKLLDLLEVMSVVPNPRSADWYRSVGQLVPGRATNN